MLIFFSLVYTYIYLSHDALPGNNIDYPAGWWGWCDQGIFLRQAQAIAGELNSYTYRAPLASQLLYCFPAPLLLPARIYEVRNI